MDFLILLLTHAADLEQENADASADLVEDTTPLDAVPHFTRRFERNVTAQCDSCADDSYQSFECHNDYSFIMFFWNMDVDLLEVQIHKKTLRYLGGALVDIGIPPI